MSEKKSAYKALLPHIREVARRLGYAVAVHGSLNNDLDIVAVPWTEAPADHATLHKALVAAFGVPTRKAGDFEAVYLLHNRVAYVVPMPFGLLLDLTIILREQDAVNYGQQ